MQKAFDLPLGENAVEWAIEMIEAGYESANLYMLAGETKPFNHFEIQELVNKVFQEFHLSFSDKDKVIEEYACFLIKRFIENPNDYSKALDELRDICIKLDMDAKYQNFYFLWYAKDELEELGVQWYWEGANRENIDAIIKNEFQKFIDKAQTK